MRDKTPLLVAALLTWIGGFVDAVGFLSLGRLYTANMSGNSVSIGIQISGLSWFEMFRRLWPVITFVIGLLLCRILLEFDARQRIRSVASIVFVCEIVLLAPVCIAGAMPGGASPSLQFAFVALLALAMGAQNGALTRFSSLTLHTGFVTGTLLKFAEQFAKYLMQVFDRLRGREASNKKPLHLSAWLLGIYLAYVSGAACGGFSHYAFRLRALMVPIGCFLALIALDLKRPLAVQDEQQQATEDNR
ncbi:MAG: YoaK family protein [Bryobacteraceae bacterium]